MLTFEEALTIAKKQKDRINHCVEYTNAYMFSHDTGKDTDGGDMPIVIMKESGETMNMSAYAWMPGKEYVGEQKIPETPPALHGLTPEQSREFAAQYNGGLGSGMTPAEYKSKYENLPDVVAEKVTM